jgi:site-specific DNA-cytosine methylase
MNVLGVCAGNGVIIHPCLNGDKLSLIGNVETRAIFHSKGDKQWYENFWPIPLYKSIPELRKMKQPVDIIIGHPDCGHSSILSYSRRKTLSDPRDNESLNLYIKCTKKYQPKLFLMENLPKLLEICDSNFWSKAFPNYNINYIIGSVSDWGNSQVNRVRLVIIGIRKDFAKEYNEIQYQLTQIYRLNQLKSTQDLLNGIPITEDPKIGHVRENINSIITLYARFKISLSDVQKHWKENPKTSRWVVRDKKFSTAPGVYRNIENKYPNTARKANRQFNPDGLQMSPRELARIQGIPDDFKIYINPLNLQYWINKGRASVTKTPPYEIGQWFFEQVNSLKLRSWK